MSTGSGSGTVKVVCPACGRPNEVTALEVPAEEVVTCSHCGGALGEWEELLFGSDNDNVKPSGENPAVGEADPFNPDRG